MTAQQRTQAIWDQFENMPVCNDDTKKWMLHAIESAIIEHSKGELERRRKDAQRHTAFIAGCQQLLGTHDRLDVAIEEQLERRRKVETRLRKAVDALKAIKDGDGQCLNGHNCKAHAEAALKALETAPSESVILNDQAIATLSITLTEAREIAPRTTPEYDATRNQLICPHCKQDCGGFCESSDRRHEDGGE